MCAKSFRNGHKLEYETYPESEARRRCVAEVRAGVRIAGSLDSVAGSDTPIHQPKRRINRAACNFGIRICRAQLKGDAPIIGQDIFLNLTAEDFFQFEARRLPTPSGVSSAQPNSSEFFGRGEQFFVSNDFSIGIDLFKGETAFKPVEWAIRFLGVYNHNYIDVEETNVRRSRSATKDTTREKDWSRSRKRSPKFTFAISRTITISFRRASASSHS